MFERQCREGYLSDGRQTFAQYAEYVLELKERTGLKHLTLIHYRQSLKRVLPFLGHLKLGRSRPQHLNYVYQQLSSSRSQRGQRKGPGPAPLCGRWRRPEELGPAWRERTAGASAWSGCVRERR